MKKLTYKTPAIEVIEIEVEGVIMAQSDLMKSAAAPTSDPGSTSSTSSYTMDVYNWQ